MRTDIRSPSRSQRHFVTFLRPEELDNDTHAEEDSDERTQVDPDVSTSMELASHLAAISGTRTAEFRRV